MSLSWSTHTSFILTDQKLAEKPRFQSWLHNWVFTIVPSAEKGEIISCQVGAVWLVQWPSVTVWHVWQVLWYLVTIVTSAVAQCDAFQLSAPLFSSTATIPTLPRPVSAAHQLLVADHGATKWFLHPFPPCRQLFRSSSTLGWNFRAMSWMFNHCIEHKIKLGVRFFQETSLKVLRVKMLIYS